MYITHSTAVIATPSRNLSDSFYTELSVADLEQRTEQIALHSIRGGEMFSSPFLVGSAVLSERAIDRSTLTSRTQSFFSNTTKFSLCVAVVAVVALMYFEFV